MAALVLAACGSSDAGSDTGGEDTSTTKAAGSGERTTTTTTSATSEAGLDHTQFRATDVTGYEPVADSQLVMTFDDGHLSVNAGCNTIGSAYTFTDGTLTWTGEPMATQMACTDELVAQDTWLTDLLTGGVDAELDGGTLTLTSDEVTIALEAVADSPLTGTAWTLDGTIADEAVASIPAGAKPPTLTIGEDGTAQVFTGCNTGSTTVEIADDTLTFAPMAMTRMACEEAAMELEAQVTQVLEGEATYAIEGATLTIRNGDLGLVYEQA
ncbi:META domain-containing protein [Aquihabitans daechungensis]|uniref:META domain-containing protein n=1 Tax=Aquihabitans daechungensis TaxID=1052257 RepID=UPI003BA231C2